jgi:predicted nuclease of predicted toxin-antitoxin system
MRPICETKAFSGCPTVESSKRRSLSPSVVVTFDLDFGEIVALAKGRRTGVILFRLRNTRTSFVIQRLSEVISECAAALTRGAIVIVLYPPALPFRSR